MHFNKVEIYYKSETKVDKNETIIFEIIAKTVNYFFLAADAVRLSRSIVVVFSISRKQLIRIE
jgi:hypothetical protein